MMKTLHWVVKYIEDNKVVGNLTGESYVATRELLKVLRKEIQNEKDGTEKGRKKRDRDIRGFAAE